VRRREFLRAAGLVAAGTTVAPGIMEQAAGAARVVGTVKDPYGPLGAPDANGIRLPDGFTSRVVAITDQPVAGTGYVWHQAPDGGACFTVPGGHGAFVYVSNSETTPALGGGAGAIRFERDGEIADAYRILSGTTRNCAGGPTPWKTWLSAEEYDDGQVWECDPFEASQGVVRPALGTFKHEAVTVDPRGRALYLTEDSSDGRLYRFTPDEYPSLESGRLQVARVTDDGAFVREATAVTRGRIRWITVSDGPVGATRPRPDDSTAFDGGEGIWRSHRSVFFTTKGDDRVWMLDLRNRKLSVIYDDDLVTDGPLRGVDNVTVSRADEILVAEDGDPEPDSAMQINVINRARGTVGPLLQIVDQPGSEITGPAFSPAGDRLFFSSQRANGGSGNGITYEVRGRFRGRRS